MCWKQAEVEAAPEAGSNATSASELLETIRGFAQLKLQGLLTDEEFTAAKRLALGKISMCAKGLQLFIK